MCNYENTPLEQNMEKHNRSPLRLSQSEVLEINVSQYNVLRSGKPQLCVCVCVYTLVKTCTLLTMHAEVWELLTEVCLDR